MVSLKGMPHRAYHRGQHVLATEISFSRRVSGLLALTKRQYALRKQMNVLAAELKELNAAVTRKCTHAENSIKVDSHYSDNTLGGYGSTSYYLNCKDCGKTWYLGE